MKRTEIDSPALLIGDYDSSKEFSNIILKDIALDMPGANPAFRYRGTIIKKKKGLQRKSRSDRLAKKCRKNN